MKNQVFSARSVTLCGMFSALIAIGAFLKIDIPLPAYTMHFTLQWLFVLMAAFLLGPARGTLSVAVYLMMGLASYFVAVAKADGYYKKMAFVLYGIQLALNFCWSIIFFSMAKYLLALVCLAITWLMVIGCTVVFVCISRVAGSLMVPYILWLTFAAYLNMGSYILADF